MNKHTIIKYPKHTWVLIIGDMHVHNTTKVPNRFHRLMYKLLLGWVVKEVEE